MEIKKEVTMPATGEGTRGEQKFICIYPTLGHKKAHTHTHKALLQISTRVKGKNFF